MFKKLAGNQAVKKSWDVLLSIFCIHTSGLPVDGLNPLDPITLAKGHFNGLQSQGLSGEPCELQWIVRQYAQV